MVPVLLKGIVYPLLNSCFLFSVILSFSLIRQSWCLTQSNTVGFYNHPLQQNTDYHSRRGHFQSESLGAPSDTINARNPSVPAVQGSLTMLSSFPYQTRVIEQIHTKGLQLRTAKAGVIGASDSLEPLLKL